MKKIEMGTAKQPSSVIGNPIWPIGLASFQAEGEDRWDQERSTPKPLLGVRRG